MNTWTTESCDGEVTAARVVFQADADLDPIEAFLRDEDTRTLQRLEIQLGASEDADFYGAANRVVEAVAAQPRPSLVTLCIGLTEWAEACQRRDQETDESYSLVDEANAQRMVAATPSLQCLELGGTQLVDSICHANVTEFASTQISIRSLWPAIYYGELSPEQVRSLFPNLQRLHLMLPTDSYGAECPADYAANCLSPSLFPKLHRLDLRRSRLDMQTFDWLVELPVLGQLRELGLPALVYPLYQELASEMLRHEHDHFSHLETIYVDGLSEETVVELRQLLPNLVAEAAQPDWVLFPALER